MLCLIVYGTMIPFSCLTVFNLTLPATMDFNDTFLSLDHLKTSFPGHEVVVATEEDIVSLVKPPFRLTFQELEKDEEEEEDEEEKAKAAKKTTKKKKKKKGGKKEEGEPAEKAAKMEEGDDKREEGEIVDEEPPKEEEPPKAEESAIPRVVHKPKPKLIVEPYEIPSRGPYQFLVPKKNSVPFTPTQVRETAVFSGINSSS